MPIFQANLMLKCTNSQKVYKNWAILGGVGARILGKFKKKAKLPLVILIKMWYYNKIVR